MNSHHTPKIALIAILMGATLTAISQSKHEIIIQGGGGLSTLNYKVDEGKAKVGFGFDAGLSYTFFFNKHWGIGTGVSASLFNGNFKILSSSKTYSTTDGTDDFDYSFTVKNYSEKQHTFFLNIPLMIHFQHKHFYIAAGPKIGIPLGSKFENSLETLQASGYYPQYSIIRNDPVSMGFGTFEGKKNKEKLKLKTAIFASVEIGAKWKLSDQILLYTGAFLDYGLNNILKGDATEKSLVIYNSSNPEDYGTNSIFESSSDLKSFVDKVTPIAAGLKLSLAFGLESGNRQKKADAEAHRQAMEAKRLADIQRQADAKRELEANKKIATEQRAEAAKRAETERLMAEAARKEAEEEQLRLATEQEQERLRAEEEQRILEEQRIADEQLAEEQRIADEKMAEAQLKYVEAVMLVEQPIGGAAINKTDITAEKKIELDKRAEFLQQYPDVTVTIEGHTCNKGTHSQNLIVGQRRADAAKGYLVQKGIASKRITTVSKAETEPVVPNTTEANRMQNRRVVIVVND